MNTLSKIDAYINRVLKANPFKPFRRTMDDIESTDRGLWRALCFLTEAKFIAPEGSDIEQHIKDAIRQIETCQMHLGIPSTDPLSR